MKTLTSGLLIACVAPPALAQPSNVFLAWEFSSNNGATWTPNSISVPPGIPATINVRAVLSWQSHTSTWDGFAVQSLDPFVARTPGSGSGDSIRNPLVRNNGGLRSYSSVGVIAFPDLLKIDHLTDLLPPGEGSEWLSPGQTPQFEGFFTSNPIVTLTYDYMLDGTPGTRTMSAALPIFPEGPRAGFIDNDFGFTVQYVPLTHIPGSITVLPSSAPLALASLTAIMTTTRRRRR